MIKKQILSVFLFAYIPLMGFTQDPIAQKYVTEINAKGTRKHLSILASDKFEGRETGTRGAEMAARYLSREFKKLKLTAPVNGSYFQDVHLIETSITVNSFVANGNGLIPEKDFLFTGSGDARTIETKEITFIANGIESELSAENISGKVVLMIQYGLPLKNGISDIGKRLNYVKSKKPSLILLVAADEESARHLHHPGVSLSIKNGSRESSSIKENTPGIVHIVPEIANLILNQSGRTYEELAASAERPGSSKAEVIKAEIKLSYGPVKRDLVSANVMGYLEGTDLKDELLVYSAHYDHIGINSEGGKDKVYNGADDDASGTSGVLAIARAFAKAKKEGHGPRRSILFLMFTGEEKNLLGSEFYSLNPIFPMAGTITNLNIDMIGRVGFEYQNSADSTNYCYLIGSDKLSSDLHKISENANEVYTKMKIDYKYNKPNEPSKIYYYSDHYNFAKHNVPIIFYYNGKHEDYHKGSDELNKINFGLLTRRAHLAYYTGWDLANRDQRPVVDKKNDMPATP